MPIRKGFFSVFNLMKLLKIYSSSFQGLSSESWMLAVVMLINRAGSMVLPFLGVYMTAHLGFGLETAGLVLSCFGVGAVFGSWLGGILTDKIGEFKVQSISLLLSVPLFCLIPLFKTELGLAFIILIQSTVSEFFRPANSVAITKYAKKENITRSFSLNRMAVNLGFSIGPALGGILSSISYNFLFFTNALAALLAGITYISFFRKREYRNKENEKRKLKIKSESVYKDGKFLLFSGLCMLFSICFFQLLNTLPLFYKLEAGLSQQTIGFILGYSGIIIVFMEMFLVDVAEKRFRLKFTLFLGTIFCGLSFTLLSFGTSLPLLFFAMTLLCVGEIWALPFMSTVTALRSGENNKGQYMGVLGIGFSLSFIITPYLGTLIAQEFGFQNLWIGTGFLMLLTAIGFYYVTPSLFDSKSD